MSFALNSGVITQSGTDTDLSGLTGLTGVTVTSYSSRYEIYDIGTNRLDIEGDLTINPEENMFISNASTGHVPNMAVNVRDGATLTLGEKTTVGTANKYTTGTAFILTDIGNQNVDGSLHVAAGGTLQAFGATIQMAGPARVRPGATLTVEDLTVVTCRGNNCQFRIEAATTSDVELVSITENGMSLNGVGSSDSCRVTTNGNSNPFDPNSFVFRFVKGAYQPAAGGYPPQVFLNFDNGNNIDEADFSYAGSGGTGGTQFDNDLVEFRNVARRLRYTNANTAGGFSKTTKVLNFNLVDQAFTGLSTISYYAKDTNNGSRINFNGFNSTADLIYSGQNAGPSLEVIPVIEYMAGENTTRYIDDRTNNDTIEFKFVSYNTNIATASPNLIGLNTLNVDVVNSTDTNITESTKATVDAYTEIDTPQKFYNRAKAYLVDNYAGETETIVSREGNSIDAGSYNVVIDAAASSVFAISGNTLTIKATRFVGNIATSGSTTLSNDAEVIGTFGSTTVLPWEVKNVEGTSRIQLVNVTKSNAEVVNTKLSSSDAFVDATGSYTGSQISVGDVIRLRVTCVVGATALLPVLQTGVATSTGITFQVDQEADTVYNSNGINGSTVSTLTADYTNPQMGVDIDDGDSTASVKEIYAFFTHATTTADGVENWFGGMRAIDNANYEVITANADIKLQNIGSNSVVVTGGRMYRDDGESILYAENGDKPIVMDSGAPVTSIQPQVEAGLNANAKISSINNNSKLIPSLL